MVSQEPGHTIVAGFVFVFLKGHNFTLAILKYFSHQMRHQGREISAEQAHKRDRWTSRFIQHLGVGFSKQRAGGGSPNPHPATTHFTTQTRRQLIDQNTINAKDRDLLSSEA